MKRASLLLIAVVLMGCASNAQRAAEVQARDQKREQMLSEQAAIEKEIQNCTAANQCIDSDRYKYLSQAYNDIAIHLPR